ncbi:BA14K family protein [Ensifer sp. 4252]
MNAQPRRYYGGNSHTSWCYSRYRSYRAWNNTFKPYYGACRACYSPYR